MLTMTLKNFQFDIDIKHSDIRIKYWYKEKRLEYQQIKVFQTIFENFTSANRESFDGIYSEEFKEEINGCIFHVYTPFA